MKKDNPVKFLPRQEIYRRLIPDVSVSGGIWRLHEVEALAELIMKRPILDLGCGNGTFLQVLTKDQPDIGLDLSPSEVALAKKNRAYKKYIVADAHHIPLPSSSVQTIFSNSVFEHIPQMEKVLAEISRILKPGGELVFTTHAPTSQIFFGAKALRKIKLEKAAKNYEKAFSGMLQLRNLWTLPVWKKQLAAVGLKVEESQIIISPKASLLFELFLPFTFIQNRVRFLRKLYLMPLISRLCRIDYTHTDNKNRNFFIRAIKTK